MRAVLLIVLLLAVSTFTVRVNPRYFDMNGKTKIATLTNNFNNKWGDALKDRLVNYKPASMSSKKRDGGNHFSPHLPSPTASSTYYFVDVYAVGEATYYESFPGARDASAVIINPTPITVVVAVDTVGQRFIQFDAFDGEIVTAEGYWTWFVNASSGQVACSYDPHNFAFVQSASAMVVRRDKSPTFDETTVNYFDGERCDSYTTKVWSTMGLSVDPGRNNRGAISFNYMIDALTNNTLFYRFDETPTTTIQQDGGTCVYNQNAFIGAGFDFRTVNSTILPLWRAPANIFEGDPSCHIDNDVTKPLNTQLQLYTEAFCGQC